MTGDSVAKRSEDGPRGDSGAENAAGDGSPTNRPTPIFMLSPPRSGSTLLQRMLATHPEIATVSEPWIMLGLAELVRDDLSVSRYDRHLATRGIREFLDAAGNAGPNEYIRDMALDAYAAVSSGETYFLDKTPRYYLLADWLHDVFPEGRFVVLVRNPLAVAASIVNTWGGGRWNLFLYRIDLYAGMERLAEIVSEEGQGVLVRYEELVADPETTVAGVLDALEISGNSNPSEFAGVELSGSMGDPTGARFGASVSSTTVAGWPQAFANPLRRLWARRYLRRMGRETLAALGYDIDVLRRELSQPSLSFDHLASDIVLMTAGSIFVAIADVVPRAARRLFDWLWLRRSRLRANGR